MRGFIFICLFSFQSVQAQVYALSTRHQDNYLELFKDSAQVEVFRTHCHHWCTTKWLCNEMLYSKRSGDTVYSGKTAHVLKKRGQWILYYKLPYNTKFRKVVLEKCSLDGRDPLRKYAYIDLKTDNVYRLYDSLCGPIYPIQSNRSAFELNSEQKAFPFNAYRIVVDAHYDSIYKNITTNKNPEIDGFYRKIDSLKYIDSTEAFSLLANTNYELYCAKYLLKQMAKERPELLIRYIDKHYTNRDIILKTIRDHYNSKEITRNIKACPVKNTNGKTMLVSQRTNRLARDVAAGTLYTTILLAELSIIPLLIIISRN